MQLEKNTANKFIEYLLKHGYPRENIVLEWGNNTYRIDIAVLDETKSQPVAIYEIKSKKDLNTIRMGIKQLERYQKFIGYPLKAGLVFSLDSEPYFEYIDVSDNIDYDRGNDYFNELLNRTTFSDTNEPVNYKNLTGSLKQKLVKKNIDRRNKKVETFSKICWFMLCPGILMFFILDGFNVYEFTFERLTALGLLIGGILLPFFTEIRFGDFSFVRHNKHNNDS